LFVVAEARDGLEAVAEAGRCQPDVALLEANLSGCDGVRATALIKEAVPDCHVLILADVEDQATLIDALEAGASGYMTKERPLAELIAAARAVGGGEILLPPGMMAALLARLLQRRRDQDRAPR